MKKRNVATFCGQQPFPNHTTDHRQQCRPTRQPAAGTHIRAPAALRGPTRRDVDTHKRIAQTPLLPLPSPKSKGISTHTSKFLSLTGHELNSPRLTSPPCPSSTTKSLRPRPRLYIVDGAVPGGAVVHASRGCTLCPKHHYSVVAVNVFDSVCVCVWRLFETVGILIQQK